VCNDVDAVKPDPVSGLEVEESSVTVNSAALTWKSPRDDKTILFRVFVKSSADNSVQVNCAERRTIVHAVYIRAPGRHSNFERVRQNQTRPSMTE